MPVGIYHPVGIKGCDNTADNYYIMGKYGFWILNDLGVVYWFH